MRRSSLLGLAALVALAGLVALTLVLGFRVVLDARSGAESPEPGTTVDGRAGPDRPPGVPQDATAAVVDRVVDGDTIRILPDARGPAGDAAGGETGGSVRVRLLNVDAPELDHPERGRDCGALTATSLVEELLPPGSTVWLAADREDRDRFGRLLRYAWTGDGTDVQAHLVEEGLAEVLVIGPNERFAPPLRDLEGRARARGAGVWGVTCPP